MRENERERERERENKREREREREYYKWDVPVLCGTEFIVHDGHYRGVAGAGGTANIHLLASNRRVANVWGVHLEMIDFRLNTLMFYEFAPTANSPRCNQQQ